MDTYGNDPAEFTAENIANFKRQINALSTTGTVRLILQIQNYYKWTQWIFTKFTKGLAYEAEVPQTAEELEQPLPPS